MRKDLILNDNVKKDRATFGERLKELREYYECTQTEMGEAMGVVYTTIIAYEKNQKNPSIDVAVKAAEFFNVSLDWLCGFTDTMTRIVPMTYSDILREIFDIMKCQTVAEIVDSQFSYDGFGNPTAISGSKALWLSNNKIQKFLEEYEKMYNLCKQETIDEDLFNMWVEKQLKQYDDVKNRIIKSSEFSAAINDIFDENAVLDDNGNGYTRNNYKAKFEVVAGKVGTQMKPAFKEPNAKSVAFEDIKTDDDSPF